MSFGSKQSDLRAAQSEKNRAAVRVSMPVQVLAFYSDSMTVDVQPLIKERIDGQCASAAPLTGLRVACLCAGDYVIRPWYKRGDIGWVIVSDFDADAVMQSGQEAEPNTERNHAPEDGLFIGGVCPAGKAPKGLPDEALVLAAGRGLHGYQQRGHRNQEPGNPYPHRRPRRDQRAELMEAIWTKTAH